MGTPLIFAMILGFWATWAQAVDCPDVDDIMRSVADAVGYEPLPKKNSLRNAPAQFDNDAQYKARLASTAQVPLDDPYFPPNVRSEIEKLKARSDIDGNEHATMIVQIGEEFYIPEIVTSGSNKMVSGFDNLKLVRSLAEKTKDSKTLKDQPIRIFHFHTHPDLDMTGSLVKRPIFKDEAGRVYTYQSVPEDYQAMESYADSLALMLRENGLQGPIELVGGPVPANVKGSANPYVSTYRKVIGEDVNPNPAFRRLSLGDRSKLVFQADADPNSFAISGTQESTLVRTPNPTNGTIGTIQKARGGGYWYQPNSLNPVTPRINGVEIPVTGAPISHNDILSFGRFSVLIEP